MNKPFFLLLGTGAALGFYFPLGKLAAAAGIGPALWGAVIGFGAGLTMLFFSRAIEGPGEGNTMRFAAISGFISNVIPQFLIFLVIPHIGSGLASVMVALSPVVTALASVLFRVRPPSGLGLLGIGAGLAGALVIIFNRNAGFAGGSGSWLGLSMLIPLFLGLGNVYRTFAWPKGAGPMRLASLTHLASGPPLLVIAALTGGLDLSPLAAHPMLAVLQIAVSTVMLLMFFTLQHIGGPTYLSQIGYVSAAVGVGLGITVFHEIYPPAIWAGIAVVSLGIALTTFAQIRAARA